jgi:hypothetical protein
MDQAMNRIIQWLAVLALVASLGGHWVLLQGVAWTTMLARYSQSMPMTQALVYTFDGKHRCKLCLAVQHGQQAEKKPNKLPPPQKLNLFLDLHTVALFAPATPDFDFNFSEQFPLRLEQPLHPPPRPASRLS